MEQELLAFFEQDMVKKELLKFAISDVKMVKEHGGDKAEYLALFEEQGSDEKSAEYFLEENGLKYAWLASDIIYYQDLMFKLSSPGLMSNI